MRVAAVVGTVTERTVEVVEPTEKSLVAWDHKLLRCGVRVYPSGTKVYIVQMRARGKAGKRVTVGRHGTISAEEARRREAAFIARINAGEEQVPEPTTARLAKGPTLTSGGVGEVVSG